MNNPLPEGRVDDILRPEGDNPLLERGFVTTSSRRAAQLGAHRLDVADDLRPGLLRGRDDACRRRAPGPGSLRRGVPPVAAPVRRDDRGRHPGQQDGPGAAQGLRPDARPEVGDLDGQLRQRRRLLPLFLRRGARLRPHRAGRHLRAGLPADRRGAGLRHPAIAEEDPSRAPISATTRRGSAEMGRAPAAAFAERLRARFADADGHGRRATRRSRHRVRCRRLARRLPRTARRIRFRAADRRLRRRLPGLWQRRVGHRRVVGRLLARRRRQGPGPLQVRRGAERAVAAAAGRITSPMPQRRFAAVAALAVGAAQPPRARALLRRRTTNCRSWPR